MAGFSFYYFINSHSLLSLSYCNSLSDSSAAAEDGGEGRREGGGECPLQAE